ncbi:MAG: glutamate-1-semialdehyde 2,1-aminomutase [Crocinitomicaceae bacterium]|nr:glutamate-1-semialdehyde 2,1-aminomutase [Crocinitomicaceae bacterium]
MRARERSNTLFEKAKTLFPGGVNSPVRAFKSVDGAPLFMKKGDGPYIWDEDDNQFIDFCCSWGPLILGHNHPNIREKVIATIENGTSFGTPTKHGNALAELIVENNRFIDKIRFVSSGTEAVMSAIRLARGYTGKNKIIKFEGCYHGHVDALMVNAGSGLATFGTSSSAGIPDGVINETVVVPLNDEEAVKKAFEIHGDDIAAVIIEPIPANNGLLLQETEFLTFLRTITRVNSALLIFDEVISGFRVGFEGAAGVYDIQPDIITYGKIIGGGLPVGAYAGSTEIMSRISPDGDVYQAGTLSANPVAMSAGYAQLEECVKPGFYEDQEKRTKRFVNEINTFAEENKIDFRLTTIGSIFWMKFTDEKIQTAAQINPDSMVTFSRLFSALLEEGIYVGPSGYEVGFISKVHTEEVLDSAIEKFKAALSKIA